MVIEPDRWPFKPLLRFPLRSENSRRFRQDRREFPGATTLLPTEETWGSFSFAALPGSLADPYSTFEKLRTLET